MFHLPHLNKNRIGLIDLSFAPNIPLLSREYSAKTTEARFRAGAMMKI
jgi:hypothetical protein